MTRSTTPTRDAFLREIEAFLEAENMGAGKFGSLAVNDTRFVARLRRPGGDVLASTMDRVRDFMAAYRLEKVRV